MHFSLATAHGAGIQ